MGEGDRPIPPTWETNTMIISGSQWHYVEPSPTPESILNCEAAQLHSGFPNFFTHASTQSVNEDEIFVFS